MPLTVVKGSRGRVDFNDFSGGVNLANWPSELAENQIAAVLNMTSEGASGGGLVSRFGCKDRDALSTGVVAQAYIVGYSPTLRIALVQANKTLLQADLSGGGAYSVVTTFTTNDICQGVEFKGQMVVAHPVDGVFTWTGSVWTSRSTTVKGGCIAAWQNIVWVGGDTSNRSRLWKSNIGDATTWTTATDFVDLRDIDDQTITCLDVPQGMDINGRPGLLVAKPTSLYRINTPSSGAYTTLSPSVGANSKWSMATSGHYTYILAGGGISFWSGLWRTDGVNEPQLVSGAVQPVIDRGALTTGWVAALRERVYCRLPAPTGGSAVIGEYDPTNNAWFLHQFTKQPMTPVKTNEFAGLLASYETTGGRLGVFLDNGGGTYAVGYDGNEDGDSVHNAIVSTFQTRWVEPGGGGQVKTQRAHVRGRGASISFGQRNDYSETQVADRTLALPFSSSTFKDTTVVVPLGSYSRARAVAFDATASTSALGSTKVFDNALAGGTSVSVNAWGLERISVDFAQLGL